MTTPHDLFRQSDKIFADFDKLCSSAHNMHKGRMHRTEAESVIAGEFHYEITATKNGERVQYTIIKKPARPSTSSLGGNSGDIGRRL